MNTLPEKCHCGKPMHLNDGQLLLYNTMIAEWGEKKKVIVLGQGTYLVPTYYIIVHGLKAKELPTLGFEELKT